MNFRISKYQINVKIISLFDEDGNNMKTLLNEPSLQHTRDRMNRKQRDYQGGKYVSFKMSDLRQQLNIGFAARQFVSLMEKG